MSADITLVVRRTIRAPAHRVYDAWTSPAHLRTWWGPKGVTCVEPEVDLRVGGRYRIGNELPDGRVIWIAGEFEEIVPHAKLVYTWRVGADRDPPPSRERVTVRFEPRDGATEIIILHEQIASPAVRDDHEGGWIGCLDGLAALLDP